MKRGQRFAGIVVAVGVMLAAMPARAWTEDVEIRIGSKAFTESVILGEMLTQLAASEGAVAQHRAELGGTQLVWKALLAGEIDAYPEYTGTLREEVFARQDVSDDARLRAALAEKGIGMTGSLGFNNSYALGMRRERAEELNISKISDLASHTTLRYGLSDEFLGRKDGWPMLVARYDLPQRSVRGIQHELTYVGLAQDKLDVIDLYSTDAEIEHYDLVVLEDDRRVFPSYEAVVLYRLDLEKRAPNVVRALQRLEGEITDERMRAMNAQAKIERVSERRVASEFLADTLAVAPPAGSDASSAAWRQTARRLLVTTREHLRLVAISLTAAVLVAIPLGVLAWWYPPLGQVILAVVGIIQTLPSLAVLVFMVPILGLGAWPAIVALFLYSLLPIVRNTYTGLHDIPPSFRESALVLGLPLWARLWRVELPLASSSIMAGIKTAAVINVGTATIGALVGAGGYGQSILTGIRLDDTALILEGAVPAALLALAVQALFGQLEKWVVPLGLRLPRGE